MRRMALVAYVPLGCWLVACGARTDFEAPDAAEAAAPIAPAPRRLAAGFQHTCVVRADATVACWGSNSNGQLGDGTTIARSTPTKVEGLDSIVEIAAGYLHTCALRDDGRVFCWGDDTHGETAGVASDVCGASPCSTRPVEVLGVSAATQIALGHGHGCARRGDGVVLCWGTDNFGQIGDGTTRSMVSTPTPVSGLSSVVQIALGGSRSCALVADGTVKCWGWDLDGLFGSTDGLSTHPATVSGISSAASIALGETHACARLADATVRCWGYGALGGASTMPGPVAVVGAHDVSAIALGALHTCARLSDGSAGCWGENAVGELGDGTTTTRRTPVPVVGLTDVEELALGSEHSCARLSDGDVRCWGWNDLGQLGDGTTTNRLVPTPVK